MPPKVRFGRDQIIDAAFNIVRKEGWQGLSARAIAEKLKSSTRPIYTHFNSMKDLEDEVVKKAMVLMEEYINQTRTGDMWTDQGLGSVLFAKHEKELFKAIIDEKHNHLSRQFSLEIFNRTGENLKDYPPFKDFPDERIENLRIIRATMCHGIACMLAFTWESDELDSDEELAWRIQATGDVLCMGLRAKIEKENAQKQT
jgi:AcrR family transcriptional regulator